MPATPLITVAICTYRRAALLPQTLASLAAVRRPESPVEMLVIDNGCEDAVREVVSQFQGRLPVRYATQTAVGIAQARNRAVAETRTPIVLFADDDVLFHRDWLVNMHAAVVGQAACDFWGGRIEPTWSVPCPAWFDVNLCPSLGDSVVRYDLGDQSRAWDARTDPPFYTANLALRVAAVRRAGMFDASLGHKGTARGSGEDSWMIKTIARAGGQGWYAADARLDHPVEPARLTKPYARRFAWRQGGVSVTMLAREQPPTGSENTSSRVPRWLYRVAAGQVVNGVFTAGRGMLRRDPARAFAGQYQTIFGLSKLWHAMKQ